MKRPVAFIALFLMGSIATARTMATEFFAQAFPEANALFQREPRWLGGDAAITVPLSEHKTLWLFGDSFIATTPQLTRTASVMVRNTIAIQTGPDPRTAQMRTFWKQENTSHTPMSFFADKSTQWYWPGHGIRLAEGPLVVFLYTVTATADDALGFKTTGYDIAIVKNPDATPDTWNITNIRGPATSFDAIPATAVIRQGDHLVAVAISQLGTHKGALIRYPIKALINGDIAQAQWWTGELHGWVDARALNNSLPAFVFDDAGAECSVHWDARLNKYLHVASYGFGASTIGVRTASALTGPWSAPIIVYRPPESDRARPFVYAAKAHPQLHGARSTDLLMTYATNSFTFTDLLTASGHRNLYWPRFVRVSIHAH